MNPGMMAVTTPVLVSVKMLACTDVSQSKKKHCLCLSSAITVVALLHFS